MVYLKMVYSDGRYEPKEISEELAKSAKIGEIKCIAILESVWKAWQAHLNQDDVFQLMWRMIDDR